MIASGISTPAISVWNTSSSTVVTKAVFTSMDVRVALMVISVSMFLIHILGII